MRPGYKQTEIGVIPEDWGVRHLGELGTVVRGGSPRPAGDPRYFNGNYLPWLTVAALTNVPDHQIHISETFSFLTEEGSKYSRTLEVGTLIIANSGATLGVAKLLDITCCANDGIAAIVSQRRGDREFLCHYINTQTTKLREEIATGNGQPNLNTTIIRGIPVPFPSPQEQSAIATALSDVDALLASLGKLIAKKRDLKQATMQRLLTGKTRLPGFAGEWEETAYGTVVRNHSGNSTLIKGRLPSEALAGLYPGYSASGQDVWCDRYEYEGDALIVSAVGSRCGKTFAATGKWCAIANTHVIWPNAKKVDSRYINYFLNDEDFWVKGGSGQPFVLFKKSLKKTFLMPSIEEQTAIAEVLGDMDAELAALEQRREKTRLLKQGMMQVLLTGKTRLM